MTRLASLSLLLLVLLGAIAGPAPAHDGAHGPFVLAKVVTAQLDGRAVDVVLTLTGLDPDHSARVNGLAADDAVSLPLARPVEVPFAQDVTLRTRLRFDGAPPGIFTLTLDFGADGQGGVAVMPVPAPTRAND
ncbi:MAG: hypothetical protein AAF601_02115 [Pseudomonadota bacterium]